MGVKKIILGINTGHGDSSAAIIVDGELVAAAEEERFSRIKHDASFPEKSIIYCLRQAGIDPSEVTDIAIPSRPFAPLPLLIRSTLREPFNTVRKASRVLGKFRGSQLINDLGGLGISQKKIHRIEHHRAHLLSVTPIIGNKHSALLSIDGMGDGVSVAFGHWKNHEIAINRRIFFPDSLGYFYSAVTMFMGFPNYGDEFKVMGLSSLGKPVYLEQMRQIICSDRKNIFLLNREVFPMTIKSIMLEVRNKRPYLTNLFDSKMLESILGVPPRPAGGPVDSVHADIAASLQMRFEELANQLLNILAADLPVKTLGLSGGCSHNSVWVGKIPQNSPFSDIYVAPASGDAGLAVGAAVAVAKQTVRISTRHPALLGPESSDVRSIKYLESDPRFVTTKIINEQSLVDHLIVQLTQEKVIGLFRGRMEFGPRALGTRSIICDPRSIHMRDQLNARVKHREAFRPFAAFIMWEHQEEWLENSFYAPTMEAVFTVKPEKRSIIPAVVHFDNTCRIQSVKKDIQPFIWCLLDAFARKTGVPMLINTSFNDSEPVVCTEDDALNCFLHCDMDFIVFDNRIVTKSHL